MSASDDLLRVLEVLGAARPAELAAATGLPARSVSRGLAVLRGAGLVEGPQSRPQLSASGRAQARRLGPPAGSGEFDAALDAIFGPSPALSGFARLGADLIVARQLYPGRSFYPALFAYGERSGTGKTAIAELLARAFGLGPEAIVPMGHKAPGEIAGRRVRDGDGFHFEPAEHLRYPFVCLDELGEAEPEVRRRAQAICHGEPVATIEGDRIEIRATVMATWNPRAGATVLGTPYLRRALVLCADTPGVAITDLGDRIARAPDLGEGTLRLDELRRATDALPAHILSMLKAATDALTEDGRARVDRRLFELAMLGRAARYGLGPGDELAGVAYFAAVDVLVVTETVPGLVSDDWEIQFDVAAACWGDVPGLAAVAAVARRREELRGHVERKRTAQRKGDELRDLDLTGERAALRSELDEASKAITRVPSANRRAAAGVRAQLRQLRDAAGDARSLVRLDEVRALATPILSQAFELQDAIAAERRQREQIKADQAAQREAERVEDRRRLAAERANEKAVAKQQAENARRARAARTELGRLRARTTTRPAEDVAGHLVELGVLRREIERYVVDIPPLPGASIVARARRQPKPLPEKRERQRSVFVDASGRSYNHHQLAAWGSRPVLSVIDAALEALDTRERPAVTGNRPKALPAASAQILGAGSARRQLAELLPGPSLQERL